MEEELRTASPSTSQGPHSMGTVVPGLRRVRKEGERLWDMLGNVVQQEEVLGLCGGVGARVKRLETPLTSSLEDGAAGWPNFLPVWSLSLQKPPADGWLYSIVCDRVGSGPSASGARSGAQVTRRAERGMPGVVVPASWGCGTCRRAAPAPPSPPFSAVPRPFPQPPPRSPAAQRPLPPPVGLLGGYCGGFRAESLRRRRLLVPARHPPPYWTRATERERRLCSLQRRQGHRRLSCCRRRFRLQQLAGEEIHPHPTQLCSPWAWAGGTGENENGGCGAPSRAGGRGLRSRWNGGLARETCPGAGWGWGEGGTRAGCGGSDEARGLLMETTWDRSRGL